MNANSNSVDQRPATGTAFKTFEDLVVYREAREFRKTMYAISRQLPDFEKYELASQVRRAAVSLTNNIAEGHGRYHYLDQVRFCLQARGSLEELVDDLNVCEDEGYARNTNLPAVKEQAWGVHKLLSGHIRWLRERKQGASLQLHETQAGCYDGIDADLDLSPDRPGSVKTVYSNEHNL